MAKQKKAAPQGRQEVTGLERLSLRVSSMINHPIAQSQRRVTIHRLDTDGDMEWEEVMGLLTETPELDLTFNDDESVTVRWEPQSAEDRDDLVVERDWEEERLEGEEAPFCLAQKARWISGLRISSARKHPRNPKCDSTRQGCHGERSGNKPLDESRL